MHDAMAADEASAVLDALYRAAETTPGVEVLLNSIPVIQGSHATVNSVSLVLGGDPRDPRIVGCQRVTDSLHRDTAGRWQVDPRTDHGADIRERPGGQGST